MSSPTDPASLALAGNLVITSADRRLRIAGAATSELPISLQYIYAALRDADGHVVGIPDTSWYTRPAASHEIALDQFVGDEVLAVTRTVELTVPYELDVTTELLIATAGAPDGDNRVPLTITTRGTPPFVDLVAIGAYFNSGNPTAVYRGLNVFVELDVRRGGRTTYCKVTARARAEGGALLAECDAFPATHSSGTEATRRVFEISLPFKQGMAARLEIVANVRATGIGGLGPVAVEGL